MGMFFCNITLVEKVNNNRNNDDDTRATGKWKKYLEKCYVFLPVFFKKMCRFLMISSDLVHTNWDLGHRKNRKEKVLSELIYHKREVTV